MTSENPINVRPSISRTELYWLVGAVIFGAMLRLVFPGRMAIEHFDEGVYASNIWFGAEQGFEYPARHLYAPPLLPMAIEWTMIIASMFGLPTSGFVPMIPCLVAGIVMIPSIWWVGREWFGSSAGLVSACLVSASDFHACYSRAALTDVPVCLFILWSVYFLWRAFLPGSPIARSNAVRRKHASAIPVSKYRWNDVVLASIFTGLAWWTKYNGWLPLAIGLAGGMLHLTLMSPAVRQSKRLLTSWFVVVLISLVIWSPVVWGLQKTGGYASVAANHRQYVVGWQGWTDSAWKQLEAIGFYDNWIGILTQPFGNPQKSGVADPSNVDDLGSLEIGSPTSGSKTSFIRAIAFWSNRAATFLLPISFLIISIAAVVFRLRFASSLSDQVAACLLGAWICGMTCATPFYHPYPRLVLPWLVSSWLGAGLAFQLLKDRRQSKIDRPSHLSDASFCVGRLEWIMGVWMIANCLERSFQGTAHAWEDRTGLDKVARTFTGATDKSTVSSSDIDGKIVYVWGEPALVFGLKSHGLPNVAPVQNLDFVGHKQQLPTYIVFGQQSLGSPSFDLDLMKRQWFLSGETFLARPSHLVEMDSPNRGQYVLADSRTVKFKLPEFVWIYRVAENPSEP